MLTAVTSLRLRPATSCPPLRPSMLVPATFAFGECKGKEGQQINNFVIFHLPMVYIISPPFTLLVFLSMGALHGFEVAPLCVTSGPVEAKPTLETGNDHNSQFFSHSQGPSCHGQLCSALPASVSPPDHAAASLLEHMMKGIRGACVQHRRRKRAKSRLLPGATGPQ